MRKDNKDIIRRYLKDVGDRLACPKHLKATFLGDLKERIEPYRSPEERLTMESLYEKFGTPAEIAKGFFDRGDYEELLRKTRNRVVCWKMVSALIAVLLLAIISFSVYVIREASEPCTITVSDPY